MLRVLGRELLSSVTNLGMLADKLEELKRHNSNGVSVNLSTIRVLQGSASHLSEFADELGLPATKGAAQRILASLQSVHHQPNGDCWLTFNELNAAAQACGQVVAALTDELGARMLFTLPLSSASYVLTEDAPFGEDVANAFPLAAYDIEEASRCLAFGRTTAVVFHLMRAMEGAVHVLGSKLNAAVASSDGETLPWGVILANLKPKIDALPAGPDRDEWYKIHALLHSVNRAFRTKTAHPVDKYTEEEARAAFAATKAFLLEMAERA